MQEKQERLIKTGGNSAQMCSLRKQELEYWRFLSSKAGMDIKMSHWGQKTIESHISFCAFVLIQILSIFLLVVRVGTDSITVKPYIPQKILSMNLFKIICVVTWE